MIYSEKTTYERDGLKQDLPGFDKKYYNIVDYILKITEDIWENKMINVINDTYNKDVLIHTGARQIKGIDNLINGTIETLASFPDRKMGGEAVIWSNDGNGVFYSSHRIGSHATNLGDTNYGKATGKNIFFRTIADCRVANNKIFEEWLVRDNLAIIQQLGFDPVQMAINDTTYKERKPDFSHNAEYKDISDFHLHGKSLTAEEKLICNLFNSIWKDEDNNAMADFYTDSTNFYGICNNNIKGKTKIECYIKLFLNSFRNIKIKLERITLNKEEDGTTEIAVRWFVNGWYKSGGILGEAPNKQTYIPVITHYTIKNEKISKEWMVFDAFDALCQIYQ